MIPLQPQFLANVEIRWSALEQKYVLIFQGKSTDEREVSRVFDACADLPDVQGCVYEPVDPSDSFHGHGLTEKSFVRGVDHVWETFRGLRLKIGCRSFMQANWVVVRGDGTDGSGMGRSHGRANASWNYMPGQGPWG